MAEQHTLLIVDDNPVNLEMLSSFLRSAGYRVLVAEDGEAALEQAAIARPDLVLMDVLLPGMNGFDSARALHRQPATADTPVIFLTALSRTSDKIEGFRAGGVDYLTKPLQFEEVLARVRVHLQLRDLQSELVERNEALDQRDQRRNQMLGIIGHDLSAPMGSIAQGLRKLQGIDHEDPFFAELLDSVAERAEQMNEFLVRLLEWGKLQVLSSSLSPEPFLFRDAAARVLELLDERMGPKEISVHTSVPEDLKVTLSRPALETVLNNLLSNAIKFSPSGATVDLHASEEHDRIVVTVTDRGVGMSGDELARLMESDDRVQRRGTAGETGTGLGLVLTKDLVHRMRGSISARSEPGVGTSFRVELPNSLKS
jgi:signal transduction histidine kinase